MMTPQEDEINDILKEIDLPMPTIRTRPLHTTGDQQDAHTIDVYIVVNEPEEGVREQAPIVESDNEQGTPLPQAHPQRRTPGRPLLIVLVVLCVFLLGAVGILYLQPLFMPSATVTIVPTAAPITIINTIMMVTGTPTPQQLGGRLLSSVTMSQAQTVPTTGTAHQDAQAAHGKITFYNGQPSVQIITAGTLITGSDGVQVVTDQDVIIPAVMYPTLGQATVSAHTTSTGPTSNIKAGDIYGPCCRVNVSAVSSAFTGGQDARTYQTATQQDITTVTNSIKTSVNQSIQAALQTQVHESETLLTPLSCTQSVQPNRQPGDEATQIHLTINETCTGEVYNSSALHTLELQILTQEATRRFGDGYHVIGDIQMTIVQTTPKEHGTRDLHVKSIGTWGYQFSQDQLEHFKTLVAGKNKQQATDVLLRVPGVHSVSFSIKNGNTLPKDTGHIQLALLAYSL